MGHDEILSYEEILRIARIAAGKGISKIRITGGEPLARKRIIDLISQLNNIPEISDLSMTTNGVLLQTCASELRKAGLKRINISLDTLDSEKYKKITRGGDIQDVMNGIKKARGEGLSPVKINVVVMRGINDNEIPAFANLTIENPVHIRFIEFMPVNKSTDWNKNLFIPSSEIQGMLNRKWDIASDNSNNGAGPAEMFTIRGAQGKLGFISPLSNHFCSNCNRLRLTADGKLRTCLFSDDEIDIKTLLRHGCTDKELEQKITAAILSKPKRHELLEPTFKKCHRTMSAIGG